jgi:hypothetical protein
MCNQTMTLPYTETVTNPERPEDYIPRIVEITENHHRGGGRAGQRGVIYIWQKDESIADNLIYRRVRPYTVWRKQVLPLLVEKYPRLANFKFAWSQRAGCSCPCSPGFIVMPKKGSFGWWDTNLHVTIVWEKRA